jgi:hypothetical protein
MLSSIVRLVDDFFSFLVFGVCGHVFICFFLDRCVAAQCYHQPKRHCQRDFSQHHGRARFALLKMNRRVPPVTCVAVHDHKLGGI